MSETTTAEDDRKGARLGVLSILAATTLWGFSPIYYSELNAVPPLEVIVHRTLWSVPLILGYGLVTGRRRRFFEAAGDRRAMTAMLASSVLIFLNWLVFIWAIQTGRITEASLGYYIYPLSAVLLGALFFRETITRLQWLAVGIATLTVLAMGLRLGAPPWIALAVSSTFAVYGAVRKAARIGPLIGMAWELVLLAPLALGWLIWIGGGVFGEDFRLSLLLAGSSLLTSVPLILFVEAAKRMRYATVGLLFYVNPTLQLVSAALLGEVIAGEKLIAFGVIWCAVALYCADLIRQDRRARTAASASSGVSATS